MTQELVKLTILITEFILRPHAASSVHTMNRIDKPVAASKIANGSADSLITQQSRRHAWP